MKTETKEDLQAIYNPMMKDGFMPVLSARWMAAFAGANQLIFSYKDGHWECSSNGKNFLIPVNGLVAFTIEDEDE